MKQQSVNPYLPSYEYIPDGEPHAFENRVYVYGSHDRFNAPMFCMNDYVCWSAPVEDLSDWRYEGVIYRKKQDTKNNLGLRLLFAPDVTCGPDGKYYLYYAIDFMGIMGVAVCDTPAGTYEFLGHVHYPDGKLWGRRKGDQFPFDPGVLTDEDGRVYLYSGFALSVPPVVTGFRRLKFDGGVVLELEQDMLTIKEGPKLLFPKEGKDAFKDHEFFEASSIRKKDGKYIFVYSSVHNHELCYAISDHPTKEFTFGGTLVSQGDLFLDGRTAEPAANNYLGNNHGGIERIGEQWYVFYHRQTNRHSYSRQACAEKLYENESGGFYQAEVTSCGLNPGALKGVGTYESRISCNLSSKAGTGRYDSKNPKKRFGKHPYFTQEGKDRNEKPNQYIANMQDGATAGFKYFDIGQVIAIRIALRGRGRGRFLVSTAEDFNSIITEIPVLLMDKCRWVDVQGSCGLTGKSCALYFRYEGEGFMDFKEFELVENGV